MPIRERRRKGTTHNLATNIIPIKWSGEGERQRRIQKWLSAVTSPPASWIFPKIMSRRYHQQHDRHHFARLLACPGIRGASPSLLTSSDQRQFGWLIGIPNRIIKAIVCRRTIQFWEQCCRIVASHCFTKAKWTSHNNFLRPSFFPSKQKRYV